MRRRAVMNARDIDDFGKGPDRYAKTLQYRTQVKP
jgi:hypothetical protein